MEIRLTLDGPLKAKILDRMVKSGTTSARSIVKEILEQALLKSPKKK